MPAKIPKSEIPDHASAEVIGAFAGVSRGRVVQYAVEGIIPKSVDGVGYAFQESVRKIADYRARDAEAASHRERKNKAEADTAEVVAAEKLGEVILKKDARGMWADATVEVRKLIQSKPTWKAAELLKALATFKPDLLK